MSNNDWGKNDEIVEAPPGEEPGWFQPGSKTDTAVRSIANIGTGGLAPRASAFFSSELGKIAPETFGTQSYNERLGDYLDADKYAQDKNPWTSALSAAGPALLQAVATGGGSLLRQGAVNTAMGAVNAAGNSRPGQMASDATTGGLVSGALSTVPAGIGKVADVVSRKYAASTIAKPIEDLIKNKTRGWQDEVAKHLGESKKTLIDLHGSMENAAKELADKIRSTGRSGPFDLRLADMPEGVQSIIDKNIPSLKDIMAQIGKTTLSGGAGAAGGVGLNYALGSPMDVSSALMAGAGLNAFRGLQTLGLEVGKKGLMGMARSGVPEDVGNFINRHNTLFGAANQMGSQSIASEFTDSKSTGGFKRLTDFLAGMPGEEKRKQAMNLSATPKGRSFGNNDSPVVEQKGGWGENDEIVK